MVTLIEYFKNIPHQNPGKKIDRLPELPEDFVAYYPGSGQDRRLCRLLNEMNGTVVYQDPIYNEEEFKYSFLNDRLITISEKVTGYEKIESDLVYIDSMGILLFKDNFVENVCKNSKDGAYLTGRKRDLAIFGFITNNLYYIDETLAVFTGEFQHTDFYGFYQKYPLTLGNVVDGVFFMEYDVKDLANLTTKEFLESKSKLCLNYGSNNESIESFLEKEREELAKANEQFYEFLGEYTPGFVKEAKGLPIKKSFSTSAYNTFTNTFKEYLGKFFSANCFTQKS